MTIYREADCLPTFDTKVETLALYYKLRLLFCFQNFFSKLLNTIKKILCVAWGEMKTKQLKMFAHVFKPVSRKNAIVQNLLQVLGRALKQKKNPPKRNTNKYDNFSS